MTAEHLEEGFKWKTRFGYTRLLSQELKRKITKATSAMERTFCDTEALSEVTYRIQSEPTTTMWSSSTEDGGAFQPIETLSGFPRGLQRSYNRIQQQWPAQYSRQRTNHGIT